MNNKLQHKQNIITRGLPKTGQATSYVAGDDGEYETGWWVGRLNANNRQRWIAKTIGGDDVVLDLATGLMWAADGNAAGCNFGATSIWTFAITYCNGLNFAGFTDWRLPNVKELQSIVDFSVNNPCIQEPPFANTVNDYYRTSTTQATSVANAYVVRFSNAITMSVGKLVAFYLRAVRKGI